MGVALADRVPADGPIEETPDPAARRRGLRQGQRQRGLVLHAAVVVAYSALTALLTWPAAWHLRTRALSNGADGSSALWNQWYLPHSLLGGHNPFGATRAMFWPVGANLIFHSTAALPTLLAAPLVHAIGLVGAFNVVELSALPLSGYAMWLLARRVCGDSASAFVAGAAFAFVPYHFVHTTSHVNLLHVELLPFALLAALVALDGRRGRSGIPLGFAVAAALLTDFTLTALVLAGLAVMLLARRRDLRTAGRALVVAAAVAAIVALPVIVTLAGAVVHHETATVAGLGGADRFSSDLLSWFIPSASHPLWGSAFAPIRRGFPGQGEGLAFPGWTVLGLATAALAVRARRGGAWLTVALTGVVLSLGPFLMINARTLHWITYRGASGGPPLPYLLLTATPAFANLRVPGRFAILGIAGLDVLAALGLAALRGRLHAPRARSAVALGALLLVVLEFLPGRIVTAPVAIPRAYSSIAADHTDRAVLELPMQWRTGFETYGDDRPYRDDTMFLYYATAHHHPVVSGMAARLADSRMQQLLAVPMYQEILGTEGDATVAGRVAPPLTFTRGDLQRLGIGFVVCHRDVPSPGACGYVRRLGLPVLSDDGTVTIWAT